MKNILSKDKIDHITNLCKEYKIENYTINTDGSIDVDGNVNIAQRKLKEIPIHFNKVSGNFICFQNKLKSLNGCPNEVGGDFLCYGNSLITLKGVPKNIPGNFDCSINKLTTLEYCPDFIGGDFIYMINSITSLLIYPSKVMGDNFSDGNDLPEKFSNIVSDQASRGDKKIVFKYMNYFEIWNNGFNEDNMDTLVDEIHEGLQ